MKPRQLSLMLLVWAVIGGGGCAPATNEQGARAPAVQYQLKQLEEPRPNRVHVLRVDLSDPGIQPRVVVGPDPDGAGPAEAALTDPRQLADDPRVLAYINTNPWRGLPGPNGQETRGWFEGQPVDISGLTVSQGQTRSAARNYSATVWVDGSGDVQIGERIGIESAQEAAAGFQPVVTNGNVSVEQGEVRHPRTAIGVDREGRVVWLVVVDGRQEGYSEGMTLHELGEIMMELGCWNAINMDGGGSSIMGLRNEGGELRIVNSPSDRVLGLVRIRPLPTILTIMDRSGP